MTVQKHIVFDFNGTLQDDLGHIYKHGVCKIFEHFKRRIPPIEEYRDKVTSDFMTSFYWPCGIPKETTAEDLNRIMFDNMSKSPTARLFEDAKAAIDHLYINNCTLHIVSGYPEEAIVKGLASNNVDWGMFRTICGGVTDKVAQLKQLRHYASAGLFFVIGDSEEDVTAALNAHCGAFLYTRGFSSRKRCEQIAEYYGRQSEYVVRLVDSLTEFAEMVTDLY